MRPRNPWSEEEVANYLVMPWNFFMLFFWNLRYIGECEDRNADEFFITLQTDLEKLSLFQDFKLFYVSALIHLNG